VHLILQTPLFKGNGNRLGREELKIFWVGLLDGDGSIQVNHWKKKY
jgi:hypothetical protein